MNTRCLKNAQYELFHKIQCREVQINIDPVFFLAYLIWAGH
jgi:hypothetical protein